MTLIETGFKAVWHTDDGRLISAFFNKYNYICIEDDELEHVKKGCVEYVPGKLTVPNENCGPLGVFTDVHRATAFMKDGVFFRSKTGVELWTCEFTRSRKRKFWVDSFEYKPTYLTILADKIKLIEKIDDNA